MESKDGVRAAFQQWNSAQRSPHRTSRFHHIRRSNSGCFSHCRTYFMPLVLRAYCSPSGSFCARNLSTRYLSQEDRSSWLGFKTGREDFSSSSSSVVWLLS